MLFELFNRFWRDAEMSDYKSQEANLYFYLVHYCNKNGWVNPFSIPNKLIVLSTGLSEKTVIDCRCRLQQRGLIDFVAGKRKAASPQYCFPVKKEDGSFYFPWESKTESKNGSKTGSKTGSFIYKTKDYKTEDISPVGDAPLARAPVERSLFEDEEKKSKKRKAPPKPKQPEFVPPTLDEVKSYFLGKGADKVLQDWESDTRRSSTISTHSDGERAPAPRFSDGTAVQTSG